MLYQPSNIERFFVPYIDKVFYMIETNIFRPLSDFRKKHSSEKDLVDGIEL
jgi:hypothetical protein